MAGKNTVSQPVADDSPAPVKGVAQAAAYGTKRDLLVAMRDRIAKTIDDGSTAARDLAPLTNRLLDVVRALEELDTVTEHEESETVNAADADFDPSSI